MTLLVRHQPIESLTCTGETKSWQSRGSDDRMTDVKGAAEYIVSIFREPLESRGVCISSIQDEVEEAVEYAQQYLAIGKDRYTHWVQTAHISKCTQMA